MKDEDKIEREVIKESEVLETEHRSAEQAIPERRILLPVVSMFVLVCFLALLNEILDLPCLLLGAPPTPVNWREAVIEVVLIASVGLFVVLRLTRDITEWARAEEALRDAELRYRTVADFTYDWEYWERPDGTLCYVSPACERISGYAANQFIDNPLLLQEIVLPEDREIWARHRHNAIEAPELREVQCRIRRRDGETVWIEHACQPVADEMGAFLGVRASNRDITERKRAEEQLRRQSAVLDGINKVFLETLTCESDEEVARTCLAVAEELTGSKFGFICEVNQVGRFDTIAISDPGWEVCRIPKTNAVLMLEDLEIRGIRGRVVKDERSMIFNDPASHPDWVGAPEGHPPITSFLGVPLKHAGKTFGMIGLANKESGYDLADQQAIEILSVAFVEALNRKRADEALQRSLEQTARGQRLLLALSQAAQAVQRARTPDEVYRTVVDEVSKLGYNAAIFTLIDDRAHLAVPYLTFEPNVLWAAEKLTGLSVQGYRFPLVLGGLFHRIIIGGETTFTESPGELIAEALPRPVRPLAGRVEALLGIEQGIIAPLAVGGETNGLLVVAGTDLTKADVSAVTAFANQTAIALENAQLLEAITKHRRDLERLSTQIINTQEAERKRISRELHDELGQTLTGLKLLLDMSTRLPTDEVTASLDEAQALVNELITSVRGLSLDLRPAMLDDLGLLPALLWHFDRYTAQTHVRVTFKHSGLEGRFAPEVETAAYRIVQEVLTNVARHADVSQVMVRLWTDQDTLGVQIEDQGTGFDAEATLAAGATTGLAGMRERAVLLGGRLTVESAPGAGTRVTAELPLGGPVEDREER